MGQVIVGIIVIILVISFIVWLLAIAATIAFFTAWMLTIWYLGRQLWRQYHRYRLQEKFWLTLAAVGFLSLLIVINFNVGIMLKIFIAALLFTLFSVIAVEIWGFKNKRIPFSRWQLLRDREHSLTKQISNKERELADLQERIAKIERDFSEIIEHQRSLADKISDFCVRDAAVWGLKRKQLEEEYARLGDQELSQIEAQLRSQLASGEINQESVTLATYILQLERLKREMSGPQERLDSYQMEIRKLQSELGPIRKELERVCREKELYDAQIAESTKGLIGEIREDIAKDYLRFRQFCSRVYQRWNQG